MENETKRALVQLTPSGELYIIEYQAVWRPGADGPEGTVITRTAGPIYHGDLPYNAAEVPSAALFNIIDTWPGLSEEDTDWLQEQEDAGRLRYPAGVR